MFPLYTKTFGGKIWKNLHSVSPDNFLSAKFKIASFTISRQNSFKHHLVQKSWKQNAQLFPTRKKFRKKYFNLVLNRANRSQNSFARGEL